MRAHLYLLAATLLSLITAACYSAGDAAPGPTGEAAPANQEPKGTTDPGSTQPMIASTQIASLKKAKVLLDQPLHIAVSAAMAADAREGDDSRVRALMDAFAKSLGVKCDFCHVKKQDKSAQGSPQFDFAVDTEKKKVAERMWDEWVAKLAMTDGSPLFCDSCHQGKSEFLDRSDEDQLHAWMKQNFAEKLVQKDGSPVGRSTCHGRPFNGSFLDDWSGEKNDDAKSGSKN